ncbi:MAG: hypothetical protein LC789_11525 [Actinobacteria bacterium]|nr:hypothetical protein [Actinomycetota bacterium]MCA1719796.1 hypothetical protein [Actinomycetota bacterium]
MRAVAGWAVVAALTLTGCGGSSAEEPQSLPTLESVAASPSPSPSAVVAVPPEAAGETPQAAAEFAKFFYKQVERAFATKNPGLISRLSLPTCETCAVYVESLTELRDNNESVEGGHFTVTSAVSPGAINGVTPVDVSVNFSGSVRKDSSGKVIEQEEPMNRVEEELQLKRSSGVWIIAEIKRIRVRG